jgi:hypothetical protein
MVVIHKERTPEENSESHTAAPSTPQDRAVLHSVSDLTRTMQGVNHKTLFLITHVLLDSMQMGTNMFTGNTDAPIHSVLST